MKKRKKKVSKRISPRPLPSTHANKSFLVAIISIIAVIALALLLLFSQQFVGKAILQPFADAPNSAGAVLGTSAYTDQPFSLKIKTNTGTTETSYITFTLSLPPGRTCSDLADVNPIQPSSDLAEWTMLKNGCMDNKILFNYASLTTTKKGIFEIAQINFKGLPAGPYPFTFDPFQAFDTAAPPQNIILAGNVLNPTIVVETAPSTAVCGDGVKATTEACDDGNTMTESCSSYDQACQNICDAGCELVTVQGPYCGDGIKNGAEQCDGTGNCNSECKVVLTATCGDNVCDVKQESTASCSLDCGEVCPTNNLAAWWKGENNAQDNSISEYHGTVQNIAYQPGVVGQAFKFDGVNSIIDLGSKAGTIFADPTGQSLSISFWMKTNALTNTQDGALYILDSGAGTEGRRGFYCNTQDGDLNCAIRQESALYQASIKKSIPLNSWKLITLTFDDTTKELKLYLDGSFSKSGTEKMISGDTYASEQAIIGATNTKQLLFKGLLDEISVWDRALSAAEVNSLFGSGTTGMCAKPTSVCGNKIVEAGEECDDGNNDDGDNCSSICLKESAICGDNVCEIKFESTASCKQDCGLVCPTNELVSWWKGEDDQDSFSNHHGTRGGEANFVSGKVNNAFYFDGEGDYFTLGQKPGTIFSDPTGESISVSFWMKTNVSEGPGGALYILDSGAGAASRRGFYCNTKKGALSCIIKHAEKIYEVNAVENTVPLNVWKFVTFTCDTAKEELKLYVDGVAVATGTKASLSSLYQPVPASVIGATSLQTLPFNGALDEIAVWNRVLTSAEVKSIFDTSNIGMCAVPEAICGNGFVETGEECDDSNQITTDLCNLCKNALCGDGIIRTGIEQCDGSNLGITSCQSLGFANGTLSCASSCLFNSTACMAAPAPAPIPPVTTLTVNGTKISLGDIAPANNPFATLLTATEGFTPKIMIYTILYNADGKVLKLESDELTGMNKDAWLVVTANHPSAEA